MEGGGTVQRSNEAIALYRFLGWRKGRCIKTTLSMIEFSYCGERGGWGGGGGGGCRGPIGCKLLKAWGNRTGPLRDVFSLRQPIAMKERREFIV